MRTLVPAHLDGDPKNWLLLRKDGAGERNAPYSPMLATMSEALPTGEGWVYEPKWDGFRAIVTVSGGEVSFVSRNGNDLTERFREVARGAQLGIRAADVVLDGEICALDEQGRSRFALLQAVPALASRSESLLWAVNNEFATDGRVLLATDMVACFPPVSGG